MKEEIRTVADFLLGFVTSSQAYFSLDELYLPYFPSLVMKAGVKHSIWPAQAMPTDVSVDSSICELTNEIYSEIKTVLLKGVSRKKRTKETPAIFSSSEYHTVSHSALHCHHLVGDTLDPF